MAAAGAMLLIAATTTTTATETSTTTTAVAEVDREDPKAEPTARSLVTVPSLENLTCRFSPNRLAPPNPDLDLDLALVPVPPHEVLF